MRGREGREGRRGRLGMLLHISGERAKRDKKQCRGKLSS